MKFLEMEYDGIHADFNAFKSDATRFSVADYMRQSFYWLDLLIRTPSKSVSAVTRTPKNHRSRQNGHKRRK